jgi:hypothetical protein
MLTGILSLFFINLSLKKEFPNAQLGNVLKTNSKKPKYYLSTKPISSIRIVLPPKLPDSCKVN